MNKQEAFGIVSSWLNVQIEECYEDYIAKEENNQVIIEAFGYKQKFFVEKEKLQYIPLLFVSILHCNISIDVAAACVKLLLCGQWLSVEYVKIKREKLSSFLSICKTLAKRYIILSPYSDLTEQFQCVFYIGDRTKNMSIKTNRLFCFSNRQQALQMLKSKQNVIVAEVIFE